MPSGSGIDKFLPPRPDETGIAGIGIRRSQGQQPRGIGEALGYGLMNVSDMASEALPGFISNAGQAPNAGAAFGGGLGLGLLSSLGQPGRVAAEQSSKRELAKNKLQSSVIEHGMRYMSQKSLNKLFAESLGEGYEADLSGTGNTSANILYRQSMNKLIAAYLDPRTTPEDRASIKESILKDEGLRPIFEDIIMTNPGGDTFEELMKARAKYTNASWDDFINPTSDKFNKPEFLVPKAEPGSGGAEDEARNLKAKTFLEIKKRAEAYAAENNVTMDAAYEAVTQNDRRAGALADSFVGISSANPTDLRQKAVQELTRTVPMFMWQPKEVQEQLITRWIEMNQGAGVGPEPGPRSSNYEDPTSLGIPRKKVEKKLPFTSSDFKNDQNARRIIPVVLSLMEYGVLDGSKDYTMADIVGAYDDLQPADKANVNETSLSLVNRYKSSGHWQPTSMAGRALLERAGLPSVPASPMPGMVGARGPGISGPPMEEDEEVMEDEEFEE